MPQAETVLLVEDNADDVILLQVAFAHAGIRQRLEVVTSGREAVRYLGGEGAYRDRAAHPFPVLLLLDLLMPDTDGYTVLQWLGRHPEVRRRVITIVLTGDASEPAIRRAHEMGAQSVLLKPVSLKDLQAMMLRLKTDWLEAAEPGQPARAS